MAEEVKETTAFHDRDNSQKDFFLFYGSWHEAIKDLPAEIKMEIYEATIEYGLYGTITELSPMANVAFCFIKNDIDRNNKTYEERKRQRSEAGKKGNEARWGKRSQDVANDSEESQNITNQCDTSLNNNNESNISQTIANENETSQAITENRKISQSIANNRNVSQMSHKEKENEMKRNEKKKISLSLTPSHSDEPSEREQERNREREDFIFKNVFGHNREKPQVKTQRLIDNRQSQGCKKANGREIIDIPPDVRLWKCEENGVRMPRSNLDFLREKPSAISLHNNASTLRKIDNGQNENGEPYLVSTRKFAEYLQPNSVWYSP